MTNRNIKQTLISWGLFISLMIPMLLDGLHYVIFHHHEEEEYTATLQFQNPERSHILCSYPFVTEELNEDNISVLPYEHILDFFFASETHLAESGNYFSIQLRGPPNKA